MQIGMREVGQLSICSIFVKQDIYFEDNDAVVIIRHRDCQGPKVKMINATFQSVSESLTFARHFKIRIRTYSEKLLWLISRVFRIV